MPKRTSDYRSWQLQKLADPDIAASYLNEALSDSPKVFLKALRQVAQARQNVAQVARDAGVTREALYREGNPTLETLTSVLDVLGIDVMFTARAQREQNPIASGQPRAQHVKVKVGADQTPFYRSLPLIPPTSTVATVHRGGGNETWGSYETVRQSNEGSRYVH